MINCDVVNKVGWLFWFWIWFFIIGWYGFWFKFCFGLVKGMNCEVVSGVLFFINWNVYFWVYYLIIFVDIKIVVKGVWEDRRDLEFSLFNFLVC